MTAGPVGLSTESMLQHYGELAKHWGWLMALGILFVVLGTIGLGMSVLLTLVNVMLFGVLIGIGGGVQIAQAFRSRGWRSFAWHVLVGVLYLIVALEIWHDPVGASLLFTLIIAIAFIGAGILRLVTAFQHGGTSARGWLVVGGLIDMLLGVIIAAHWPVSGLWVIGLFVAIELIVNGWSCIFLALAARKAHQMHSAAPGAAPSPA